MNKLISNITSYLNYLIKNCNLNVSVHFTTDIFELLPSDIVSMLLPYNSHTNAYCIMAKSINHHKCLLNQKNLLTKCQNKKEFCYVCHAGVKEYIYPVCKDNCAVGFIAVTRYRQNIPAKNGILNLKLWENTLDTQLPLTLCNSVIPPLCIMIEKLLTAYFKKNDNEYNLIIQYLNEYHANILLSDLAKHFNRSNSHISHLFKKESGMTIRAYCNDLKLHDAQKLLLNTDISITEIAFDAGFSDTSYFIYLFKKKFGISPLQYRRKNQ
ncbi:MAG: helix-turn-helix transcriptional regulator [Ruminococcaceae bacterium]|nr:helix-turn-helix transcriptional regulator [Oscillospiraceae bacterium]